MNPETKPTTTKTKKVYKVKKTSGGGAAAGMVAQLGMLASLACVAQCTPAEAMNAFYASGAAAVAGASSAVSSIYTEDDEDLENKFSLVIRKPQEGKTFICISNITTDKKKNIHIVLTMNTLASGMQFFGRMEELVGAKRIIVFNSKKSTAGNCLHAKDVNGVMNLLRKHQDVKVIVCCAHEKRIRESLPQLFTATADSKSLENRKFTIHIDEAHVYIPANRENVRDFNALPSVVKITGYTATSIPIYATDRNDALFYKIHIMDVEEELSIIRSPDYFGVKNCDFKIYDDVVDNIVREANIEPVIPSVVFERANSERTSKRWYGAKTCFEIGNETLYLGFLKFILPQLNIEQTEFSYNFLPAYLRKVTHYQAIDMILQQYPNANVVVMNGNGMELYRASTSDHDGTITSRWMTNAEQVKHKNQLPLSEKQKLLEPSYMIQKMIEPTRNFPTFVTGYTCVGMSVTLINETLGNFDNVVMAHQHLNDEKLYQLCRFLFNYRSWPASSRANIKSTKFHSLTKWVADTCRQYEEYVERLSTDFAGKTCSLREIDGLGPELPTEREKRKEALDSIRPTNKLWTQFKVYDDNDEEMWGKADEFYKSVLGKEMKGRANPRNKKDEDGFYQCSTTAKGVTKQRNDTIKNIMSQSWHSTFSSLYPNRTEYARVFVGYDNLSDNTEYTIYIKAARLERSDHTLAVLAEYGKKSKKAGVSTAAGAAGGSVESSSQDSSSDEE